MNDTTTGNTVIYYGQWGHQGGVCPGCGHCQCCGRYIGAGYHPHLTPWPWNPFVYETTTGIPGNVWTELDPSTFGGWNAAGTVTGRA